MQRLYTTTALALLFGLAGTAYAAGTGTKAQSAAQQSTPSQQQQAQQPSAQTQQQQQAGQGQQMQALGPIDTNNDGRISAEEARTHRERAFSALDANQDSTLSRQETGNVVAVDRGYVVITRLIPIAVTADVGTQMLSQIDQDQDQEISRQEYMQYGEQQFQKAQEMAGGKLTTAGARSGQQAGTSQSGGEDVVRWREADVDQNGDSIISHDEAAAAWTQTFNELDRDGNNKLGQDELGQIDAQKAMVDQRFAKLDANGDGQISKEEFTSAGENLMSFADFNQDGEVTAWEYRAVRVTDQ